MLLIVVAILALVQFSFSVNFFKDSQLTVLEAGYEGLQLGPLIRSSFFSLVALFVLFDLELVFLFPGIFGTFLTKCYLLWEGILLVIMMTLIIE